MMSEHVDFACPIFVFVEQMFSSCKYIFWVQCDLSVTTNFVVVYLIGNNNVISHLLNT